MPCPAGLLFGLPTSELTKKALHALMSVPTMPSRLLPVNRDGEPASKWGPKMNVAAKHSDGQPLKLTVQVRRAGQRAAGTGLRACL